MGLYHLEYILINGLFYVYKLFKRDQTHQDYVKSHLTPLNGLLHEIFCKLFGTTFLEEEEIKGRSIGKLCRAN